MDKVLWMMSVWGVVAVFLVPSLSGQVEKLRKAERELRKQSEDALREAKSELIATWHQRCLDRDDVISDLRARLEGITKQFAEFDQSRRRGTVEEHLKLFAHDMGKIFDDAGVPRTHTQRSGPREHTTAYSFEDRIRRLADPSHTPPGSFF